MEVDCGEHGGTHVLHALPTKPVAKVELCSIKQVERDMRLGCEAWLMLIQPATHVVATEADTCAEGVVVSDTSGDPTRSKSIITDGFGSGHRACTTREELAMWKVEVHSKEGGV